MIDVKDLPQPVQKDVQILVDQGQVGEHGALALRQQAASRNGAAIAAWQVGEWAEVVRHWSLAIAYVTASLRYEEGQQV